MATAADIQEAIDDVVENLVFPPIGGQYPDWMTNMFTKPGFDALAVGDAQFWASDNVDQRTVFDWVIPSLLTQRIITADGSTVLTTNLAIQVVLRTLLAVQAAQIASRITQDQEDTVVAAYNDAF